MKIKTRLQGNVADVSVLMRHPMETGMRKDPATGDLVSPHFIQRVVAMWNGKTVMDAQWGQGISRNPFVNFRIRGAKHGDKIAVNWEDNKGEKASLETTID